jgi:glyoxylase-like metal-dependent hydrolase (beta-lactamase superfamily II)
MKTWVTSSGYRITRIIFGSSNVYLLSNGTTRLLVDTGAAGDGKKLLKRLGQAGRPDAVIMTHTHFDHAGNAGMLKQKFSPVFIVQGKEKDFLESGDSPIPQGTTRLTRLIRSIGPERVRQWFHVAGVKADIVFDERYDLSPFGFQAYVLHTPGHSAGSSCVIVDNEIALAGDALGGFVPGSVFPIWGDDAAGMIHSWKKILDAGCHTFHPSHGFPVSREMLEKEFVTRNA